MTMTVINKFNKLLQPISNYSSLIFFRIAFGLLMAFSHIRFMSYGWVKEFYIQPTYFFKYFGFEWITPLPSPWIYIHYILIIFFSLMISIGFLYRFSTILFFILFTYAELMDQTNYLNHYYFISLISFLMIFMPLHYRFSLDSFFRPKLKNRIICKWPLLVLRFQIGMVYFFAGIAKLKSDWLFEAQPLKIWLRVHEDFPLIGPLLTKPLTAYIMSWTGAFFDLTIVGFLLWRKTRFLAYLGVLFFHIFTWKLFNIGMFPWIMIFAALIFFPPDWPIRFINFFKKSKFQIHRNQKRQNIKWNLKNKIILFSFITYFMIQILIPLRHHFYPGNVLWTEEGFNFSWQVMLMEKNGYVEYKVIETKTKKKWVINPKEYLTPYQVKQMSTKPKMILALAHHIEEDFKKKNIFPVEIYAETSTSLNGRRNRKLIDNKVDLTKVKDSFSPASWILPLK